MIKILIMTLLIISFVGCTKNEISRGHKKTENIYSEDIDDEVSNDSSTTKYAHLKIYVNEVCIEEHLFAEPEIFIDYADGNFNVRKSRRNIIFTTNNKVVCKEISFEEYVKLKERLNVNK